MDDIIIPFYLIFRDNGMLYNEGIPNRKDKLYVGNNCWDNLVRFYVDAPHWSNDD